MKNQTRITELFDLINEHECKFDPNDGCRECDLTADEIVRIKNENDNTTRYLKQIRQGIFQF